MNDGNVDVTQTFTYLRSLFTQLRTRSQSTAGASPERDEIVGRRCVAVPILVQKDEGSSLSLAGPPGLAVFL